MGSYAAFYLAGMYPLPATKQFLLSSPFFPQISFFNPIFGTTTTIKSKGFVGNPASGTGKVFVKVPLVHYDAIIIADTHFSRASQWMDNLTSRIASSIGMSLLRDPRWS